MTTDQVYSTCYKYLESDDVVSFDKMLQEFPISRANIVQCLSLLTMANWKFRNTLRERTTFAAHVKAFCIRAYGPDKAHMMLVHLI